MKLSPQQLAEFDEQGYLFLPNCFSEGEVAALRSEVSNHITKFTREEWIAHRDFTPIEPVSDDALLQYARNYRVAAE